MMIQAIYGIITFNLLLSLDSTCAAVSKCSHEKR